MKKLLLVIIFWLFLFSFTEAKDNGSIEYVWNDVTLTYNWESITYYNEKISYNTQKCPVWYHVWTAEDWSKTLKLWYYIKWKDHKYISLDNNDFYSLSENYIYDWNYSEWLYTIKDYIDITETADKKWIIRTSTNWPKNHPYLLVYNGSSSNSYWWYRSVTTSIWLESCENVYLRNAGNQCDGFHSAICFKDENSAINNWFSKEYNDAYIYAYNKKITTMPTIEDANMYWEIKRMEIAKMLSNWVASFWFYKDRTAKCNFTDTSSVKWDLATAIKESCQYWIMWQWITEFRPYDKITKWEVATAVSRILRKTKYNWWTPYYINHVNALINEWILSSSSNLNTNELRWNVMTILMKANDILEYNSIDCNDTTYLNICTNNKEKCPEKCRKN